MKRFWKITAIVLAVVIALGLIATSLAYVFSLPFKKQVDDFFKKPPKQEQTSATTSLGTRIGFLEDNMTDFEYRLTFAEEKDEINSEYFSKELTNLKEDFKVLKVQFENDLGDIEEKLLRLENKINNLNNSLNLIFSKVSNPNLLKNSDFRVNQREKSSYTEANKYTVDRWMLTGGSLTVNVGNVSHTSDNSNQGIRQYIEHPEVLSGRTITVSAELQASAGKSVVMAIKVNGSLKKISGIIGDNTKKIVNFTYTLPTISEADKLSVEVYSESANTTFKCYWTKLEIGEIATSFSPKMMSEEFVACQRYYYVLGKTNEYEAIGIGQFNTSNTVFSSGLYATEMRNKPTMKLTGELNVRTGNKYLKATKVSNFGSAKSYQLSITTNGEQTAGMACDLFLAQNSYLEFDAEIY